MFEQYTERAARVLKQAGKVSKELGQNYVGTEHILIAILRDAGCAAAQLLAERKVEEKAVLELIRDLISPHLNTMFVTPKDIDETVKRISFTISEGINLALSGEGQS